MDAKPLLATSEAENTWTTKAPIPKTESVRAAVVNGKIYVIGGSIHYEYDPATDSWVEKTLMPTPRTSFGIAVYQNKIYTIGGRSGWTQETGAIYSGANEVYDPSTDSWEKKEPMLTNRPYLSASVVGGKIHLFSLEGHDIYDVASDSWAAVREIPHQVSWLKSAVIDDKIYVMSWNLTQIYDPKSDTWSFGDVSPVAVSNSGVCATTGVMAPERIYVIGGSPSFLKYTDVTQVYDTISDTWVLGEPMPTARAGSAVVAVGDQIYMIGGSTGMYYTSNANERYTPFGYGTTPPVIDVASPVNQAYNASSVSLDFSLNKPAVWMGYSLDGRDNVTVNGNTTLERLSNGLHNVTVYARDNLGNTGISETISFNVAVPFPITTVVASVITVAIVIIGLLVYFKKRHAKSGDKA
jgi:N-acetylneuraminic acid mutarotase